MDLFRYDVKPRRNVTREKVKFIQKVGKVLGGDEVVELKGRGVVFLYGDAREKFGI